jgi:hypothetical protein
MLRITIILTLSWQFYKEKPIFTLLINGFSFSLLTEVAFLKSDSVHCNN